VSEECRLSAVTGSDGLNPLGWTGVALCLLGYGDQRAAAFPEQYAAYMAQTGMLVPRLFRRR
jgi:hypothetical protein